MAIIIAFDITLQLMEPHYYWNTLLRTFHDDVLEASHVDL